MMQLSDHVVYEVRDAMMVGKSFSADIKLVCVRFKKRVDSGNIKVLWFKVMEMQKDKM